MPHVHHLRVRGWPGAATSESARRIDALLTRTGSTPLDVPWTQYEYDDPEHFTEVGMRAFVADLTAQLPRADGYRIVSDSTLDHGPWAGARVHECLAQALAPASVEVSAVAGSGFVAGARRKEHFRARLVTSLKQRPMDSLEVVVLIGGWNDLVYRPEQVSSAVLGCMRLLC